MNQSNTNLIPSTLALIIIAQAPLGTNRDTQHQQVILDENVTERLGTQLPIQNAARLTALQHPSITSKADAGRDLAVARREG